ncbi:MAG: FecR domain-containing protein, partial [Huintestinicola sp.]
HLSAIVIGAISLISFVLFIIIFTLASSTNTKRTVVIEDITGSAFILKNDGQVNALKKMKLESGDVLITAADSTVRLTADKDKQIYIEPETTVYISYTELSEKGSIVVNISEGAAVCRLDSKLRRGSAFEIRTPNAVVSAAGTVFRASFRYYDDFGGNKEAKITDVLCADGNVNIQLYDNQSSPAEQLMLLAAGKSARLMTARDTVRYEYLNSDTDIYALGEETLKILIRIAAERNTAFSLSELNTAYQSLLSTGTVTEPVISTMYPPAESETTAATTESRPQTTPVTSDTSDTTAVSTTEPSETSVTTVTQVPTETSETAISVTSPTTAIYTVSTKAEETREQVTQAPQSEASAAKTTVPAIVPADPVTVSSDTSAVTAAPTETHTQISTETRPWWEIINSAALED